MVVGHEIVGKVVKAGPKAEGFKEGDLVGIGAQCDSCLECEWCKDGTCTRRKADNELTVQTVSNTVAAVSAEPTLPSSPEDPTEGDTSLKEDTPTSGGDLLTLLSTFPTRSTLPKPHLCFAVVQPSTRL